MKKLFATLSLSVIFTSLALSAAPQQAEIILSSPTTNHTPADDAVSGVRKHHRASVRHRVAKHRRAAQHRAKNIQAPANDAVHEANDVVNSH